MYLILNKNREELSWVMSSLKHSKKAMTVAQKQRMTLAVSSPKVLPPSLFISLCILLVQNSEFFFSFFSLTLRLISDGGHWWPRKSCCWNNLLGLNKWLTSKWESLSSLVFYVLFVLSFPVLCAFLFLTKSKGESFVL